MTRLILTGEPGVGLMRTERADVVVPFCFRFVWGPLPSPDELASYVAARSASHGQGRHWSDYVGQWRRGSEAHRALGSIELCRRAETVELWFDLLPNDQLQLIWLLDHLHVHPEIATRLKMRVIDFPLIEPSHEELGECAVPDIDITEHELKAASLVWQAYRASTPEACFGLLGRNLSALPLLRPALLDLLEELPSPATGLGATEMRLLELIARGYESTNALFQLHELRGRRVFNSWEMGDLLVGMAHGPTPAVMGLDDALRTLRRENYRGRDEAYKRSELSLTEFGEAVLAHEEDFSRHNPVHRWWGGTELTSDRLWRFVPMLTKA
ncbi:MAG: hypothetical protein JOY90_09805 [Bradyrhizobium sp.]|nr:hypothetical protein [Bradyrhizobium sp.]